ncbi:MAG TPA: redox-sensing transcriptional repressor Rex [Acidimicrobiales bacterium]|nr:redox-sensing transcriptional repressor Rex [Acidimicrobiales bacterium]
MPTPYHRRIPGATVARLPVYQRILLEMVRGGTSTVSSDQLADMARVNASKVRKDLSFLGSFGTRGSGYDAEYLLSQIDRELGLDGDWPVAIVGLGNLGRALANSPGFTSRGFRVAGLFDVDTALVGRHIRGVAIHHLDDFEGVASGDPPKIGVIATPGPAAQGVADRMVRAGVGSVLNFAPRVLSVPANVLLRYVDLSIELQVMSFYLSHGDDRETAEASSPLPHVVGLSPAGPS